MDINFQTVGKIPVLSSISGLVRVLRGVGRIFSSKLDNNIASETREKVNQSVKGVFGKNYSEYSFENDQYSLGGRIKHGFADIGRGLVEIIPIVGNIAVTLYDNARDASRDAADKQEKLERNRPTEFQIKEAENKRYKKQIDESPSSGKDFWKSIDSWK